MVGRCVPIEKGFDGQVSFDKEGGDYFDKVVGGDELVVGFVVTDFVEFLIVYIAKDDKMFVGIGANIIGFAFEWSVGSFNKELFETFVELL